MSRDLQFYSLQISMAERTDHTKGLREYCTKGLNL